MQEFDFKHHVVYTYYKNKRPSVRPIDETRLKRIFSQMRDRCTNPKSPAYKYYGQRGIRVLWNSYSDFYDDMVEDYFKHCKEF